jgi:hypothetical protein
LTGQNCENDWSSEAHVMARETDTVKLRKCNYIAYGKFRIIIGKNRTEESDPCYKHGNLNCVGNIYLIRMDVSKDG